MGFPEKCGEDNRSGGYKGGSRDGNRDGGYRRPNRDFPPRRDGPTAADMLEGPCTYDYFTDDNGKRKSSHPLKECRTFLRLQAEFQNSQRSAANHGQQPVPGTIAYHAPPPPPLNHGGPAIAAAHQQQ